MHRRFKIGFALGLCALLGGWLAISAAWRRVELPKALDQAPPATRVLADIRGRPFFVAANEQARECYPIALREAGQWLPLATVGIEDHRFWQHGGVDFQATTGAALRNIRNLRIVSGASTLTQQLVKITSGRSERTFQAKIYEAAAAWKLDHAWDKKKILEAYLNRLDYGNRRIGPEAAAQAYFGKSAANLSLAEAIYLAGLPQSPARLNPWKNPAPALARYRQNVARMAELKLLPAGTTAEALLQHPPQIEHHDPPNDAPDFAAMVPSERENTVQTFLDLDLQHTAERLLKDHLAALSPFGVGDAAIVVVENATGAVRAMACAGKPSHAQINAAAEARSCGSTLKPFLYATAIDGRVLTAASLLPDTQEALAGEYRDYDPQNYSKHYFGPVRVREALGNSLNVPAVVTLSKLGARPTFAALRQWGFQFPEGFDAYGAGFILGNAPVRPIDLAAAYAGLSRGGLAWAARFVPRSAFESQRPVSAEASAIITDVLCDNAARRLSFGNSSPLNLGSRVAVKTGTSSGFRDGWCAGFDAQHTVVVWAGNLNGKPMAEILAVRSAAPLWAAMMRHLLANGDTPLPEPQENASLRHVDIAAETGLLPRPGEATINEWFLAGTEPTTNAATWYQEGRLVLPLEYAAWCAGPQNRLGAIIRSDKLRILFPTSGSTYVLNSNLPPKQQSLHLVASEVCDWRINEKQTIAGKKDIYLALQQGDWTVEAVNGTDTTEVHFSVVP